MGFLSDSKPYTAITANIERLTGPDYDEDDVAEIVELLEIITIKSSPGATEAARAIRKKLKYGNPHQQARALTILDALVENGGTDLAPLYRDDNLLERLRLTATDPGVDKRIQKRMQGLFYAWKDVLQGRPGYEKLAQLHKELPQRRRRTREVPRYLRDDDDDDDASAPQSPTYDNFNNSSNNNSSSSSNRRAHRHTLSNVSTGSRSNPSSRRGSVSNNNNNGNSSNHGSPRTHSSSRSRANRSASNSRTVPAVIPNFNIKKERSKIDEVLAQASSASTNLTNCLRLLNRDLELATENEQATASFDRCRKLRRVILRYIHSIESNEEVLGPLIHANEELVSALQLYDTLSRPDSDSEGLEDNWHVDQTTSRMNHMSLNKHSRSNYNDDDFEEDDDDYDEEEEQDVVDEAPAPVPRRAPPPISPKPANLRSPRAASKPKTKPTEDQDEDNPFADDFVDETSKVPLHKPMW